jgi:hypothetical protein
MLGDSQRPQAFVDILGSISTCSQDYKLKSHHDILVFHRPDASYLWTDPCSLQSCVLLWPQCHQDRGTGILARARDFSCLKGLDSTNCLICRARTVAAAFDGQG